jgi:hypothetical protein
MTQEDRQALRDMRSEIEFEYKGLLRRTVNHISMLESKLHAVRTFAKAIDNEARFKHDETAS